MRSAALGLGVLVLVAGCSTVTIGIGSSHNDVTVVGGCRPVSWACGSIVKIDARRGSRRWQVQTNGAVDDVVPDGRGGVYAAGGFTTAGGAPHAYLVHVLADGRVDPGWRPRVWTRSPARFTQPTLALGDGRLFVSGLAAGRADPIRIVAVDPGTGRVDPRWGRGLRVRGRAALAAAGHRLYVGATVIQGHPCSRIRPPSTPPPASRIARFGRPRSRGERGAASTRSPLRGGGSTSEVSTTRWADPPATAWLPWTRRPAP